MKLFDPDNIVFSWLGKSLDMMFLSLLWLVCCIPVITIFPASIALYDAVVHGLVWDEGYTYRRFFRTLWRELKRGILLSLLWIFLAADMLLGYLLFLGLGGSSSGTLFSIAYLVIMLVPLGTVCWVIALESRFYYGFWKLHYNSFLVALGNFPTTLLIVALLAIAVYAIFSIPLLIGIAPALMCTLQSVFIERVIKKMMPKEEAAPESPAE